MFSACFIGLRRGLAWVSSLPGRCSVFGLVVGLVWCVGNEGNEVLTTCRDTNTKIASPSIEMRYVVLG